ncbi:GGDEF domain-containing protein [Photobacterium sp. GJ3]|uniref:sensor domain-containing diguanylate cyclase n=1 Tax=Photobacterium sp. GJ3 TaxID=2829502 RepID=UPI001B8C6EAB|nr:diguanylate cyclase [Photobacterium sp. GJ3]QUJ68474.1 GGDEF domain-containing protein [Photobacterium sp. GJ3]
MDLKLKYLINLVIPVFLILVTVLIYVGYSDYKAIQHSAYAQSRANVNVAQDYLNQHHTAAGNQLYLLAEILKKQGDLSSFLSAAQYIVERQNKFLEIGLLIGTSYYGTDGFRVDSVSGKAPDRPWYDKDQLPGETFLSPIYQSKSTQQWCVAMVRKVAVSDQTDVRILIELDVSAMSADLSDLKTMEDGYVFGVDVITHEVVIHPEPERLGTKSVGTKLGLVKQISAGEKSGEIPSYEYKNEFKFSVYDTNDRFGWVLLSGTRNHEITASALKMGVVGGTLLMILIFILLVGYLFSRVHQVGGQLLDALEFEELHIQLSKLLNDTIGSSQVYLFVMNEKEGILEEHSYHLRENVPPDLFCRLSGCQQLGRYCRPEQDPIVRRIAPRESCIRLPLVNMSRHGESSCPTKQLIGLLYIIRPGMTYPLFAKMIVNYAVSALNQLLLAHHIRSEDQMTGLKNKNFLRKQMESRLEDTDNRYYLAMIDIDDFKSINDTYGHLFGDQVILQIAALMHQSFHSNTVLCRYGGEEFAVLMEAPDSETAREKLVAFCRSVSAEDIHAQDKRCSLTVSIGFSLLADGMEFTISQADKALYRVKSQGKNRVLYAGELSSEPQTPESERNVSPISAKLKNKTPSSENTHSREC